MGGRKDQRGGCKLLGGLGKMRCFSTGLMDGFCDRERGVNKCLEKKET